MAKTGIDKGVLLIILIVAVLGTTGVVVTLAIRTNEVSDLILANERISVLFTIELADGGLITQALYYQPATARGALFDVPADTGVVVRSLNRVDSIATVYSLEGPDAYVPVVSELLGVPIRYTISLDLVGLGVLVDLMDGLPLYVPDVPDSGPDAVLVPSGDVILDGAKLRQYLSFYTQGERERERIVRYQRTLLALLERLGAHHETLAHPSVGRVLDGIVTTNMERSALLSFFGAMESVDPSDVMTRHMEGVVRDVQSGDQQIALLFPHQEGRWLRESVRQVVENLRLEESVRDDNIIIRLEILNGTGIIGLASRTAELFRSYGFDVISVGNAGEAAVTATVVVNRTGNNLFARRAADIIRAPIVEVAEPSEVAVDVTVILGSDFDGRYVR